MVAPILIDPTPFHPGPAAVALAAVKVDPGTLKPYPSRPRPAAGRLDGSLLAQTQDPGVKAGPCCG